MVSAKAMMILVTGTAGFIGMRTGLYGPWGRPDMQRPRPSKTGSATGHRLRSRPGLAGSSAGTGTGTSSEPRANLSAASSGPVAMVCAPATFRRLAMSRFLNPMSPLTRRRFLQRATCGALVLSSGRATHASGLPRESNLHVPFPPGGSPDLLARLIGEALRERWASTVVVHNSAGANGEIGLRRFLQQDPDGSHWMIAPDSLITINPSTYPRAAADPLHGLLPMLNLALAPQFILVRAEDPIRSLRELVEAGRNGAIDFGSGGIGSQPHLVMLQLGQRLGIRLHHVPYRTNGLAALGVARGEVRVAMAGTSSLGLVHGGKLRIVAVSTPQRHPSWPDVRTIAEDLPGFAETPWIGVFALAATPNELVAEMTRRLQVVISEAPFRAQLESRSGLLPALMAGPAFAHMIEADARKYRDLLRQIERADATGQEEKPHVAP